MAELTDDAKKAISDAIAIVREDRFEKFARDRIGKHTTNPANPGVEPPAPKPDDPSALPGDGNKTDHSRYWGELLKPE